MPTYLEDLEPGAEYRSAGGRCRKQSAADRGEREQRNDQPGRQADTAAEYATDTGRCFVLLGDAHLAVLALFDDGSVVCVHHSGLGMQVLDQLVIRLGVLDAGVHPDIRHECVDSHFHLLCTDSFTPTHQSQSTKYGAHLLTSRRVGASPKAGETQQPHAAEGSGHG